MVSFDVKFLFTMVLIEHTIIIRGKYETDDTTAVFTKLEIKKSSTICTVSIMIFMFRLIGLQWAHHGAQY